MLRFGRGRPARTMLFMAPALLASLSVVTAAAGSTRTAPSTAQGAAASTQTAAIGPYTCQPVKLARDDFPGVPRVVNKFFPLVPGTHFAMNGNVLEDDGKLHPHRIETTVTDLTKVIDGVTTVAVLDVDIEDGYVQESELFFEAQDEGGTVWNFGEYPEEYNKGKRLKAPDTWLAGVDGARAGIGMPSRPRVGDPPYLQGLSKQIEFKDCALVFRTGQSTCVKLGCYDNVLINDEYSPGDPQGGHQRKYYAPGVGNIRVVPAGGQQAEKLELVSLSHLCPNEYAPFLQAALDQDHRGYHIAPGIYSQAPPVQETLPLGRC
jgi:hypothetical protein